MQLVNWGYTRRYNIKAAFDLSPRSLVTFRQKQAPGNKESLTWMERLISEDLGTLDEYNIRKSIENNAR